jgi:hypothetical protein
MGMACRLAGAVLLCLVTAWAANIKLYLADGTYSLVREYQVNQDRVRYYSVERSEWEEIPLSMVDLKRTETEAAARKAELEKEAQSQAEEEAAAREIKHEISKIPVDPGVYWIEGKETKVLPAASSVVHNDKMRSVLKALSPIPMVSGKATLELDGTHSTNVFTDPEQEFFIQLSETERFGIVKLTVNEKEKVRVVEKLTIIPVTKETVEERQSVEIFRQQLGKDEVYKIWPQEALPPGEYAVVQYSEGKLNIQIWDFAISAKK